MRANFNTNGRYVEKEIFKYKNIILGINIKFHLLTVKYGFQTS